MTELLPCPFCGGEADVHYFAHDDSECTVMCSNPNCRASVSARSCGSMTTAYNRARKLWNRRAERTCKRRNHDTDNYYMRCCSCSRCNAGWFEDIYDKPFSYCPHCGAKVVDE